MSTPMRSPRGQELGRRWYAICKYQQRRVSREREDLKGGEGGVQPRTGYRAPAFARRIRAIATVGVPAGQALPAGGLQIVGAGLFFLHPHTESAQSITFCNQSPAVGAPISCYIYYRDISTCRDA